MLMLMIMFIHFCSASDELGHGRQEETLPH